MIDVMTITNRLKEKDLLPEIGGASYLASLVNKTPSSYNCEEYANIIHRKRILRDLIAASYEIGRLGLNEDDDVFTTISASASHVQDSDAGGTAPTRNAIRPINIATITDIKR